MKAGTSTSFDFHQGASRLGGVTGTGFSSVTGAAFTKETRACGARPTKVKWIAERVCGPSSPSSLPL
ncbi:hypothetical protein BJG94_19275 [Rhizobium sp. Td3]|nr:hypothetical protein BJG94_19275 [Rhizobium sp. Td3]